MWDRYARVVRAVIRGALGPDLAVEDLVQEVFIVLLRSAATLRDATALRPFLLGVSVRLVRVEWRRRKVRRIVGLSPTGTVPDAAMEPPDVEASEALRALYRILERMPSRRRLAFSLRHIQGCELTEVASALGVSESTTKREIARARAQILRSVATEPSLLHYVQESQGGPDV